MALLINAGGQVSGNWIADVDYTGGTADSVANTVDTSLLTYVPPQAVLRSERWGDFSYLIDNFTPNSSQKISLFFTENYFSTVGLRIFDVVINGTTVLNNFDIMAIAGAKHKAIQQDFTVNANGSGQIMIEFHADVDYGLVNGILIGDTPTGSSSSSSNNSSSSSSSSSSSNSSSSSSSSSSSDCGSDWYSARLTNYESYPDPGSDECVLYNGCTWAGQFYGLNGVQPESWVAANNIIAVHLKDWNWLGLKTLNLRQGNRRITGTVYDGCSDSDCNGCCTANLGGDGYLIDVEKYTMQRFGTGSGTVEFQVCN